MARHWHDGERERLVTYTVYRRDKKHYHVIQNNYGDPLEQGFTSLPKGKLPLKKVSAVKGRIDYEAR